MGAELVKFCRAFAPASWRTNRDPGSFEIGASRFAPYAGFLLNAPQRPAQPTKRKDLLSFLFAQDIAHSTESRSPTLSMSCRSYWPVLRCPSLFE